MKAPFQKLVLVVVIWFGLLLLSSFAPALRAADVDAGFEQANKLYELGKFGEAAGAYDKLLSAGRVSAALYFNRGNALFKQGRIGRAIASYRLAQQISPRDPDVRANLQFARIQARGGAAYRETLWQRWLGTLSLNEWTAATAGAFWLLLSMLALKQWRPELGRSLRAGSAAALLAVIGLGISLAGAFERDYFTDSVIVITGEAVVRNGPLEASPEVFKLRDGIELEVIDRYANWLRVIDPAQRIGWVPQDQTMNFGAPGKPAS